MKNLLSQLIASTELNDKTDKIDEELTNEKQEPILRMLPTDATDNTLATDTNDNTANREQPLMNV